jgi:hypothetical protein
MAGRSLGSMIKVHGVGSKALQRPTPEAGAIQG